MPPNPDEKRNQHSEENRSGPVQWQSNNSSPRAEPSERRDVETDRQERSENED
jgi:hypothetical protein